MGCGATEEFAHLLLCKANDGYGRAVAFVKINRFRWMKNLTRAA
jgi:hypothetical protein